MALGPGRRALVICTGALGKTFGFLGDAAGTAIQSGVVDSTIGRLALVGAFGIGVADAAITDVANMDTHRTSGLFRWSAGATGAPGTAGAFLHISRLNGSGEGRHIQLAFGSAGLFSTRYMDTGGTWNAWTSIHVNGNALTATTLTGTGTVTLGSNAIGGTAFAIADDAVVGATPPRTGGFARLTCSGQNTSPEITWSCDFFFDTGGTLLIEKQTGWATLGSLVNVVTTDVTGTTGTDGRVTVAVQAGVVKVENRSGATRTFQLTYL